MCDFCVVVISRARTARPFVGLIRFGSGSRWPPVFWVHKFLFSGTGLVCWARLRRTLCWESWGKSKYGCILRYTVRLKNSMWKIRLLEYLFDHSFGGGAEMLTYHIVEVTQDWTLHDAICFFASARWRAREKSMHCRAEKWFVLIIIWTWVVIRWLRDRELAMSSANHQIDFWRCCVEDRDRYQNQLPYRFCMSVEVLATEWPRNDNNQFPGVWV